MIGAYVWLSLAYLGLFAIGDLLYLRAKWQAEHTRKLVHMGSGVLAATFPFYFSSHWWVLAICASFLGLLYLSIRFNFLKGINSVGRKTYGSVLYPISIYLSFVFYQFAGTSKEYHLYLIPALLLAFPDPVAALVGRNYPIRRFSGKPGAKSWGGSLAFAVTALLIVIPMLALYREQTIGMMLLASLIIAVVATLMEALSVNGLDNLFIPLGVCICLYFL